MDYLFLYILDVVGNLEYFSLVSGLGFILLLISLLIYALQNKEMFDNDPKLYVTEKRVWKALIRYTIIFGLLCIFLSFIPSKQTVALMGGLHYSKKVVTNERIEKINKVIDLQLDNMIKELNK